MNSYHVRVGVEIQKGTQGNTGNSRPARIRVTTGAEIGERYGNCPRIVIRLVKEVRRNRAVVHRQRVSEVIVENEPECVDIARIDSCYPGYGTVEINVAIRRRGETNNSKARSVVRRT